MRVVRHTWLAAAFVAVAAVLLARTARDSEIHPLLESGFRAMYGLDFGACEATFAEYQAERPDDPLAYASQAACVLFKELHRLEVLDAEFYTDDKKLFGERKTSPDPGVKKHLSGLTDRATRLASEGLARNPKDVQALFARSMANGLMADYGALVEHKYWASARLGKAGLEDATELLQVDPAFYDAYIWPGVTNYVVGSLPFPIRWLAKLRGFPGNKQLGITHLQVTADKGTLLKPYAKILLVVANLRANDRVAARVLLSDLSAEFPTNPLFEKHARRLEAH